MSILFRGFLVFGVLLGTSTAQAAAVKNFVVKCIHREEISDDDIYLAAMHDGQLVSWDKSNQKGTSNGNAIEMKENSVLALDAAALAKLKFDGSLQIAIKEKDLTADETIGTVTIKPNDGSKTLTFKTKDYEYKVEYIVE